MDKVSAWIDELEEYTGRQAADTAVQAAKPLKSLIEELNTENQLFQQGRSGQGLAIVPAYRPMTVRIKKAKGQPFNRVTLRDTGDFHRSIQAVWRRAGEIEIQAGDSKANDLKDKYGDDILGLNDDSLTRLRDKLRPILIENLRKSLANA